VVLKIQSFNEWPATMLREILIFRLRHNSQGSARNRSKCVSF